MIYLFVVCAALCLTQGFSYTFERFITEFGKEYKSPTEYLLRKQIFEMRLKDILQHNKQHDDGQVTWFQKVTRFADMTDDELQAFKGRGGESPRRGQKFGAALKPLSDLPKSIDWRDKGAVSAVKNQGSCGSCWAFAATETLESHWQLTHGDLPILSPQQIVDCAPNPNECGGTGGCEGSIVELAYDYLINATNGGLALDEDYRYTQRDGYCKDMRIKGYASVKSHVQLESNSYEAVMNAVATVGPVAISVAANEWFFYGGGIFDGCSVNDNVDINHAVQLVGYGEELGKGYWIVRNSWGTGWGERGYIRLARHDDEGSYCGEDSTPQDGVACKGHEGPDKVCGTCGILFDVDYPVVA